MSTVAHHCSLSNELFVPKCCSRASEWVLIQWTLHRSCDFSYYSNGERLICKMPTSSVLFDGAIPVLIGLDGNTWASQFLTIYNTDSLDASITFNFTDTPGYAGLGRVEMEMLICPEWGISVQATQLSGASSTSSLSTSLGYKSTTQFATSSCASLWMVCFTVSPKSLLLPIVSLQFSLLSGTGLILLAQFFCSPPVIGCTWQR